MASVGPGASSLTVAVAVFLPLGAVTFKVPRLSAKIADHLPGCWNGKHLLHLTFLGHIYIFHTQSRPATEHDPPSLVHAERLPVPDDPRSPF